MALAKKCDRCGVLYEHYSDFNSYMMTMINTDKHGHIGATSKRYDLCPECMRSLTNFMEAPQKEIDNSKDVITPKLITELYKTFYDNDTGVCYIAIGEGVTPLYNADGTLKIYKESK